MCILRLGGECRAYFPAVYLPGSVLCLESSAIRDVFWHFLAKLWNVLGSRSADLYNGRSGWAIMQSFEEDTVELASIK